MKLITHAIKHSIRLLMTKTQPINHVTAIKLQAQTYNHIVTTDYQSVKPTVTSFVLGICTGPRIHFELINLNV